MKIKLDIINNNILLFKFKNMREISLTFFRVQEYYESQSDKFLGKKFSVFDFLKENMDNNGFLSYFNMWEGYNIPGHIFNEWIELFKYDEFTEFEQDLFNLVIKHRPKEGMYYIIAALEKDARTIDHELAHALYYLNPCYRTDVSVLTNSLELHFPDHVKRLKKYFKELGYHKNVYDDEIQAYLATERTARLKDPNDFDLKCTKKFLEYVQDYRNFLIEYKEQLDNRVVNVL